MRKETHDEERRKGEAPVKAYAKIKRSLDLLFSCLMLAGLSPLLAILALAVRMDSPGPALFKQDRLGYKGKTFKIYKFRSMVVDAEKKGSGVYSRRGDPRVTRVGAFIRKTSLDELPQLVNIARGEMSFIGPRPTLVRHPWPLEEYTDEQRRRFDVLPGVTGLAQINGRKGVPWVDRIKMDVRYVEKMGFLLDLRILLKTIVKVVAMDDNYNTGKTAERKKDEESQDKV